MKNTITKLSMLTLISFLFFACSDDDVITGSDNVITFTRDFSTFNQISAESEIVVNINQGNTQEVSITVNDNLQDRLLTDITDGTLNISIISGDYRDEIFQLDITLPELKRLAFNNEVSGVLNFNLDQLDLFVNDESDLTMIGTAEKLIVDLTDESRISAFSFVTDTAEVKVVDDSQLEITCEIALSGSANDESIITYRGNPTVNVTTGEESEIVDGN